MQKNTSPIAIVGGGPGGLTLAVLLQQRGIPVTVFERDENRDVRVQGATLDLHQESGLEALRRAGLLDSFYANYRPEAGRLKIVDKNAVLFFDDHKNETSLVENRPEIDRGPLRKILLEALAPDTVVWDRQFQRMEEVPGGWKLFFRNGTTATASLVIGADGANSKIRPYLTPIKPVYSGVTIVEGTIYDAATSCPQLWSFTKGGKVFGFGDEQCLILGAKGDGSLSFYTSCKVDEEWCQRSNIDFNQKQDVLAWFKKAFGNWDTLWLELFNTDAITLIPRPQYHFSPGQQWETRSTLTLLGDAAHRMPPFAGEGVNMAMQDAFELADALTDTTFPNLTTAIASYEKKMLERTAYVTELTLENTKLLHSEKAIEFLIAVMNGN